MQLGEKHTILVLPSAGPKSFSVWQNFWIYTDWQVLDLNRFTSDQCSMWGYFINIFSFYAQRHVWGISLKPLFCSKIIHKRIFECQLKKVDNVGGAKKTHGRWINHISLNLIRITDTDKVTSGGERSVELPLWQYHDGDDDELW